MRLLLGYAFNEVARRAERHTEETEEAFLAEQAESERPRIAEPHRRVETTRRDGEVDPDAESSRSESCDRDLVDREG